jgi:group II intron reverse transcriptase/maturase
MTRKKVNWILDCDIRGFFDNLSHDWLLKFVQHRVADRRILRLLQKWLKAGVMEEGEWKDTEMGTPQGSVASPLLANIYLHYVFDLWVDAWRRKCARGDVIVVRYADDNVLGFQHLAEADLFLEELRERLQKFGLELHPDKTRRIEFGRFAEINRTKRGEGKPETFDFLGFTHISGKDRNGSYAVKRKTVGKRLRAKLLEVKQQLRRRMHEPVTQNGKWLRFDRAGLLQLPRSAGKHRQSLRIPLSGDPALADHVDPSGSEAPPHVGADAKSGGSMDSTTACSPSLPPSSL